MADFLLASKYNKKQTNNELTSWLGKEAKWNHLSTENSIPSKACFKI
jgi:hypothetical protein